MNPIELGKAIAEDGIAIITAVMLILVVGLVWYLIRRQTKREDKHDEERIKIQEKRDGEQKEDRDYYRGIVKNELKKNVELNVQGITLQKEMVNDFKIHNGHINIFQNKAIESLGLICEWMSKLNGDSLLKEKLREYEERGIIDRRKENKKVKADRRINGQRK